MASLIATIIVPYDAPGRNPAAGAGTGGRVWQASRRDASGHDKT
jgi:hypothetical protein